MTTEHLTDYVEKIVRHFLDDRTDGETFAGWVARADEEILR